MTRSTFLGRLAVAVLAAAAVAALSWLLAGPRWFGFYGWALAVLALVVVLWPALTRRMTALGYPRWPSYLVLGLAAVSALTQLGFWAAFFSLGERGIILGIGRTMFNEVAGPWLPWLATALTLALIGLVLRGAGPDFRPR